MKTKILLPSRNASPKSYGVTEQKKTELDKLSNEVVVAQNEVDQQQAIVDSLTEKSNQFAGYLATAESDRDQALANKNSFDALLLDIQNLLNNSEISFNEMVLADSKTKDLAVQMKVVMDKLIYSAEVIQKLSNLVTRKKALNPLISDELVTLVSKAGTDANNAVALTLVALQASFTAQASTLEAEAASTLEYTEIMKLNEMITGTDQNGNPTSTQSSSLESLIDTAYTTAEVKYNSSKKANDKVLAQLSQAQGELSVATINLNSLKAGLAAANAAALAS